MKMLRRLLSLILVTFLTFGPDAEQAIAAVDAETLANPLDSGRTPSGAGTPASGLESFKTDLFTGRASFSIPIEVPPGTNGMQPSLALTYSSGAANGWVGFGWALEMGRISRSTVHGVPRYNASDEFMLNSDKLVEDAQEDYHTEVQSFARVRHLDAEGPSDRWEVVSKDGRTLIFGSTGNSRISDPGDPTKIFAWLLDRVEDTFGNYLEVSYYPVLDSPNRYPQSIVYTRNDASGGLVGKERRVDFCLSDTVWCYSHSGFRFDRIYDYRSGFEVRTLYRLEAIRVSYDNVLVRQYSLTYHEPDSGSGRMRLASVQMIAGDGTKSPAMTFEYQELGATPGFGPRKDWADTSDDKNLRSLKSSSAVDYTNIDMNGDALPDRVYAATGNPSSWDVYLNKGDGTGFEAVPLTWSNKSGTSPSSGYYKVRHADGDKIVADVIDMNSDGKPDRVVSKKNNQDLNYPDQTYWHVYLNNGSGFDDTPIDWYNPSGDDSYPEIRDLKEHCVLSDVIDFNGDGLVDRVVYIDESWWKLYLGNGTNGFSSGMNIPAPTTTLPAPTLKSNALSCSSNGETLRDVMDINGDGLPDLVQSADAPQRRRLTVFLNKGDGFVDTIWGNPSDSNLAGGDHYYQVRHTDGGHTIADIIDVNGDGLPDRVVGKDNEPWTVYLNTGAMFNIDAIPWENPSRPGAKEIRRAASGVAHADVQDFDGDGLPDRPHDATGVPSLWDVYYNSCDPCDLSDPDDDFYRSRAPDLLTSIENGMGGSIEIDYKPSTKYWDANNDPANPNLPFPVQTVNRVTRLDGAVSGNDIVTSYTYEGGYYEYVTREFRGFRTVTATEIGGATNVTRFHQQDVTTGPPPEVYDGLKGQIESAEVRDAQGLLSQTKIFYLTPDDPEYTTVNLHDSNGVMLALPKRIETTLHGGSGLLTTAVDLAYDSFGNVTERFEEGDVDVIDDQRRTCTSYDLSSANVAAHRVGFPLQVFRTAGDTCAAAQGDVSRMLNRRAFAYHQQDGQTAIDGFWVSAKDLLIDADNPVPGRDLEVTRAPDDYGNIRSITTSPNQTAPTPSYRTTTFYYDGDQDECTVASTSTHTFPCLVMKPAAGGPNLTEGFDFDPKFGKLVERIDENDHSTLMTYDGLGRLIRMRFQENSEPEVVLREITYPSIAGGGEGGTWGVLSGASAQNIRILDYAVASGAPVRNEGLEGRVYFDGLGRTIRQSEDGDLEGGSLQTVDQETTYDARGRVHTTSLPHFSTDPSPGWATRQYDALGRLTSLQNPNGSCTTFTYDLLKTTTELRESGCAGTVRQKRITLRDGNIVEVQEFESVTGSPFKTRYKYDALNNLERVEDACETASAPGCGTGQNHVTEITYDTLSRKVQADDPAMGIWNYKYDDAGNLVQQTDAKSNFITFQYDPLDRLLNKSYSGGGQTPITFTYDDGAVPNSKGRLTKVTDAAGAVIYDEYDARGNVSRFIRDFPYPLNKRFEYSYEYDNLGRLTATHYPKDNTSGQSIGTVSYRYDDPDSPGIQTPFVEGIDFLPAVGPLQPIIKSGGTFDVVYDAFGNLEKFTDGAGSLAIFEYDSKTAQMTGNYVEKDPAVWMAEYYEYDPATLNITKAGHIWQEAIDQDYTDYDALGRLKSALGPWKAGSPRVEASYAYDALGNLTQKDGIPSYPEVSKALVYGHATNPHAVTELQIGNPTATTRTYEYDFNGNMTKRTTNGSDTLYFWDRDNRLAQVQNGGGGGTRDFVYDYTGERVYSQWVNGESYLNLYLPTPDFEWTGGQANLYVFLGSLRVASLNVAFTPQDIPPPGGGWMIDWAPLGKAAGSAAAGLWPLWMAFLLMGLGRWWIHPHRAPVRVLAHRAGIGFLVVTFLVATSRPAIAIGPPYPGHLNVNLYYYSDYKGSTTKVVDSAGNGQQGLNYWPYGTTRDNIHAPEVDVRHKFTGQELDLQFDLYYYGGRWYDPEIGRFISPDPFVPAPGNPQSFNRYSYVVNNPTNLVDPSGYFFGIFAAIFSFLGSVGSGLAGFATGVSEGLGLGSLFTVGTFDTHAVAFGLGREIGLGFTALGRDAARIAGDSFLDRALVPDRPPFSPEAVVDAIGQSVERDPGIRPQERAREIQQRTDVFQAGNGADIAGSDLANQLSHRNILQKLLSGIGGLFTTHGLIGFGVIGLLHNPSGVGLTAQRIGNYVIFEKSGRILIQQENTGISSALGFVAHTVDLGQYSVRVAKARITSGQTKGVTRDDAVTRSVLNAAEKLRELPPLSFFR